MKRALLSTLFVAVELSSFLHLENHHPRPGTAHFQTDTLGLGCLWNVCKTQKPSFEKPGICCKISLCN